MKKTFTKLAGGIMAASMILGTAGVAAPQVFAAEGDKTITITQNEKDTAKHVYSAYQIFDGKYEGTKLSNIVWGDAVASEADAEGHAKKVATYSDDVAKKIALALGAATKENDVITITHKVDGAVVDAAWFKNASNVADLLDGQSRDSAVAQAFAAAIQEALGQPTATSGEARTGNCTIDVKPGYYVIKDDVTVEEGQVGSKTRYILQMVQQNETITVKSSVPSVEKKVKDLNDTTSTTEYETKTVNGVTTPWNDSADYDVNDVIPYQLRTTLGDGVDTNYDTYWIKLTDTMCKGLDFNEATSKKLTVVNATDNKSIEVSYWNGEGTAPDNYYTYTTYTGSDALYAGGHVLTVYVKDVKDANGLAAGDNDLITVDYTATLNSNAVIGSAGNPNKVDLEYASNPNDIGEGKKTPEDKNIVFTYQVVVNKVDDKKQALAGADFELYKIVNCGDTAPTGALTDAQITAKGLKAAGEGKYYVLVDLTKSKSKDSLTGNDTFTASRIDDGDYALVETVTPEGFNSIDPQYFTVTATHTHDGDDRPLQLTDLTGTGTITLTLKNNDLATGELDGTVVNKSGTTLPSTGGIGTTIFYIVGAAAAVTAIVLLTTRRRANKED